jgi:hypothetical protein
MSEIQIGTRVAYSRAFLQSTQQLTGPAHFAWGVVTALEPLSFGVAIASVAWDTPGILPGVLNTNLAPAILIGMVGETGRT